MSYFLSFRHFSFSSNFLSFQLPVEFYQLAMNFHQRTSTNTLNVFVLVCDPLILTFCRETFVRSRISGVNNVHLLRKSSDVFDFVLMASCNSTIISNDMSVLHALINNGLTTVYKPLPKDNLQFYIPWLISEKMDNWHSIGSSVLQ